MNATRSPGPSLRGFTSAMANGVSVLAFTSRDGPMATTVSGVCSYSIDPPSISMSVDSALVALLEKPFGVSILTHDQARLALDLSAGLHPLQSAHHLVDDVPILDGAMSGLVCVPSLVEPVLDRTLVVAAVQRVAVAPARPLIWTRDPTSGVHR